MRWQGVPGETPKMQPFDSEENSLDEEQGGKRGLNQKYQAKKEMFEQVECLSQTQIDIHPALKN
jgi:hypothetical protein